VETHEQPPPGLDERRVTLEGWLAGSRRNRKRVITASAVGTVAGAVVLAIVGGPVGAGALMAPIAFGLCGAWITTAHILTFKGQIKDLDRVKKHGLPIIVRQGRGRMRRQ